MLPGICVSINTSLLVYGAHNKSFGNYKNRTTSMPFLICQHETKSHD